MNELDVFSLLGQPTTASVIKNFLGACKILDLPKVPEGKIEARFAVKDFGIDLNFVPAGVFDVGRPASEIILSNIIFFGPEYASYDYVLFSGSLPFELTFDMSSEQATTIFGSPSKTWENESVIKSQRWEIKGRHLLIQYAKNTRKIKSIEISIPKPGT